MKAIEVIAYSALAFVVLLLALKIAPALLKTTWRILFSVGWIARWRRYSRFCPKGMEHRLTVMKYIFIPVLAWQALALTILKWRGVILPWADFTSIGGFITPWVIVADIPVAFSIAFGLLVSNAFYSLYAHILFKLENHVADVERGMTRLKLLADAKYKLAWLNPFAVQLVTDAPITVEDIHSRFERMENTTGIYFHSVFRIQPSVYVIQASKNGLKKLEYGFMDLPSFDRDEICIALSPMPVKINWRVTPHVLAAGPTRSGKSTLARVIAAKQAMADPDTIFVFVALTGGGYTSSAYNKQQLYSEDKPEDVTMAEWASACDMNENVVIVRQLEQVIRLANWLKEEEHMRQTLIDRHFEDDLHTLIDAEGRRVPRIMVYFEELHELKIVHGGNKEVKKALEIIESMIYSAAKFMINFVLITPRPDNRTIGDARENLWSALFAGRSNEIEMLFKIKGSANMLRTPGVFMFEQPGEFGGVGYAKSTNFGQRDLAAVITVANKAMSRFAIGHAHRLRDALVQDFSDGKLKELDRKQRKFLTGLLRNDEERFVQREDGSLVAQ